MLKVFAKMKGSAKKVALLASLFLAVFVGLFFLVNLDLTPAQKTAISTNLGTTVSQNEELGKRLGGTTVAMESYDDWLKRFDVFAKNSGLDADPDKDGLPNYLEYVHGTNPLKTDSDGDKFSDKQEIANGYDLDAPGDVRPNVEISILKINIAAPMVWSKNELEKDMLKDLENGVAHFAKTAAPGQGGNMIISGHSSNYIWAKGDFNHIFKNLNDLQKGDEIVVKTAQKNGRNITYRYKIRDKFITVPNDEEIFNATENPTLTLSTCWPIGTTLRRVIIKAALE